MVKEHRTSWQGFIPNLPDDPADYYMNAEPKVDDDSDESDQDSHLHDSSGDEDDDLLIVLDPNLT
jgi:hypothetical protein